MAEPKKIFSHLIAIGKARQEEDADKIQQEIKAANEHCIQIIRMLDGAMHPADGPLLVSTLEQYLAIRKAGMTEPQLKAAEALKEQMKIERVVVRMHLPDSSSDNK